MVQRTRGTGGELPASVVRELLDSGFAVIPGPVAGELILYNGSVWHGHTANRSGEPRRSVQGAYIRREDEPWFELSARILPQTRARIGPLAKYLLAA